MGYRIDIIEKEYEPGDESGAFMVIAATSSQEINTRVFEECQKKGVLCNVVDTPQQCDFYFPAIFTHESICVGVSTGGHLPDLSSILRTHI